jgi:hypothetical protein
MADGKDIMDHIVDAMVGSGHAVVSDFGSETHRYDVVLRGDGQPDQTVEVHPHPMLDPESKALRADAADGDALADEWWWDVAGMGIVKAGEPWTTLTGVHDFHDVPPDASWTEAGSEAAVTVALWRHGVTATVTRLAGRGPGGRDGAD